MIQLRVQDFIDPRYDLHAYLNIRRMRQLMMKDDPIVRCPKCGLKVVESTLKRNGNRCWSCRRHG
jgi:ribosomal protein L37AE/L43A